MFGLLLVSGAAHACSCGLAELESVLDSADHVFHGTVVEVDVPMALDPEVLDALPTGLFRLVYPLLEPTVTVTFAVDGVWVGDASETMTVDVGTGLCCDCSHGTRAFPIGAEWTVVAAGDGAIPHMGGICTYTAGISSESVTEVLGTARAPEARRTLFGVEF